MRFRFNIETSDGTEREIIIDAPTRLAAEQGLFATYPGASVTKYAAWEPEEPGEDENEKEDEN